MESIKDIKLALSVISGELSLIEEDMKKDMLPEEGDILDLLILAFDNAVIDFFHK